MPLLFLLLLHSVFYSRCYNIDKVDSTITRIIFASITNVICRRFMMKTADVCFGELFHWLIRVDKNTLKN